MRIKTLIGSVVLAISHVGAQQPPSLAMTTTLRIESGPVTRSRSMRILVFGTRSRVDVAAGQIRDTDGRDYSVFDAKDRTMLTVHLSQGGATIMDFRPPQLEQPQRTEGSVTRYEVVDLGPDQPVLGFATHRYRLSWAGSTVVTYSDRTCSQQHALSEDVWLTTDPEAGAIQSAIDSAMALRELGPTAPVDSRVGNRPPGFLLRSIKADTSIDAEGRRTPMVITTEYVQLSRAPLNPALLAAPPGYDVLDPRDLPIPRRPADPLRPVMPMQPGCVPRL